MQKAAPAPFTLPVLMALAFVLFHAGLPFLYDATVPEVSGDIRWAAIHTFAFGSLALIATWAGWQLWRGKFFLSLLSLKTLPPLAMAMLAALLALIVWAGISTFDSLSPSRSWFALKNLWGYCALALGVAWASTFSLRAPRPWLTPNLLARLFAWSFMPPLLLNITTGTLQFFAVTDAAVHAHLPLWPAPNGPIHALMALYPQSAVPGGVFANKNLAASWTVFALPFALYLSIVEKQKLLKITAAALAFAASVFLVYTRSRASWVAAVAALMFAAGWLLLHPGSRVALLQAIKQLRRKPRRLATLGVAAIAICAAWGAATSLQSPVTTAHGTNRPASEQIELLFKSSHSEFGPRLAYNLNGLAIVRDYPLTGTGIGTFFTVYPAYHNAVYATPATGYRVSARPQRTHNDLMQAFIELGLPGGFLHLALFVLSLCLCWQLAQPPHGQAAPTKSLAQPAAFAHTAAIAITGLSVNALMDFPLQLPVAPTGLFLIMGLLCGLHSAQRLAARPSAPHTTRPQRGAALACAATAVALAAFTVFITADNARYRLSQQALSPAMARAQMGVYDAQTLQLLRRAFALYPADTRLREFYAVAHSNYQPSAGEPPLPLANTAQALTLALEEDPFAPNHHINLANLRLTQAQIALQQNQPQAAMTALQAVPAHLQTLQRVAPFSHYTYTLHGAYYTLTQNYPAAQQAYLQALRLNPFDDGATQGLQLLNILTSPTRQP